jgi:alpha-tubulin suppressor-like RCC1 family protein
MFSGTIKEAAVEYQKPTIFKSLLGMKLVHIACGDQHVAVVTSNGSLYTWGKGSYGKLGHGNEIDYNEPCIVEAFKNKPVCYVSCGYAFTAAITKEERQLYMGCWAEWKIRT